MSFLSNFFERKSRRPKRIKNAKPKVLFDKNGNIVRIPENSLSENSKTNKTVEKIEKIEKSHEMTRKKKESKEERAEEYNTKAVPYDFPGDIIKTVKDGAKKVWSVVPVKKISAFKDGAEFFFKNKENKRVMSKSGKIFIVSALAIFVVLISFVSFSVWTFSLSKTENAREITAEENALLQKILDRKYEKERLSLSSPLPYPTSSAKLDVRSLSAILLDAESGCVLFEKNADDVIPPASITKLFVMYIVFCEIEAGRAHFEDIVPLPERVWAENLPKDSSLMFLGQGQTVTLDELLLGLSVASGNDAALAVAYFISGSPAAFVERMNAECKRLGLTHTHFVEPSGYDEKNETTARELAAFSRLYISRFPESIKRYHSQKSISYPLQKNLPAWQKDAGDSKAVKQTNTNPLLGNLEGVDGIKTGFIYESGYNLALTAERNGQRFISITMKGPGRGSREGNATRVHDGTVLMEWAFSSFFDYRPHAPSIAIPSLASKGDSFLNLVPAWTRSIPVPHLVGKTAKDSAEAVSVVINAPPYVYGEIEVGKQYGEIKYKLGEITLETVPLVASRSAKKSGLWGRFWGTLAKEKLKGN